MSSGSPCAIRAPVNDIVGLCDLLLDTELTAQQHHFVNSIAKQAGFLSAMVNHSQESESVHFNQSVHNPDLDSLWEMLGNSESLTLRVLARYKAVLKEDRDYLAGLECAINNCANTPNDRIVRELIDRIDEIIAFEPKVSVRKKRSARA